MGTIRFHDDIPQRVHLIIPASSPSATADIRCEFTSAARMKNPIDQEWDPGDLGCGELVLELLMRLDAMSPGQVFKLTSRDPGAREDLPAWCRMTGNELVSWTKQGKQRSFLVCKGSIAERKATAAPTRSAAAGFG